MPAPRPRLTRAGVADLLRGQVVLAPLTRGGNLPFRRLCASFGARLTFSEMLHAPLIAKGDRRDLVLLRRHPDEPVFGAQLAVRDPALGARAARVATEHGAEIVDLNLGCPIDSVVRRGAGAALLEKPGRVERLVRAVREELGDTPLFVKIRTGYREGKENAVAVAQAVEQGGADAVTVHGRTREQRYRRPADWVRIAEVAANVAIPVVGNGDILHASEAALHLRESGCAAVMAARGALIAPWLWDDVKAGSDQPRSSAQRLAIYRRWVAFAMEHWGDDEHGFLRIRRFLEFHVDWWRRYVPEDAHATGENTMQSRTSFEPRDEDERLLQAAGPEGIAGACDLILEGIDAPDCARAPSGTAPDPTAGGWS